MIYTYFAHGLRISSDFEIRDFDSTPDSSSANELVDIKIERSQNIRRFGFPPEPDDEWFVRFSPDQKIAQFVVEGAAEFVISDHQTILYSPRVEDSGFDWLRLKTFLLGRVLGLALYLRNRFPIHGCAVRIGEGAVIFAGHSGAGKSTLSYHFDQCGHELLADDVCCVTMIGNRPSVWPGIRRFKLWQESLDWFEISNADLEEVEEQQGKFHYYPQSSPDAHKPVPLLAVIELAAYSEGTQTKLIPLSHAAAAGVCYHHNYMSFLIERLNNGQRFLDEAVAISTLVPFFKLHRPDSLHSLADVEMLVLDRLKTMSISD